ncbi:hypothetical protein HXX76_007941 [Chlamydomonas incerta]|uniref:phytol kinase n=1 Tax=Chlamydomonas incerta TaxID=51695 RepID=A0A835W007_CHLIN|nr:hypothetical protein HXX76_007941 [Chlamydomonas incerta]|eukprot:KAG2434215.1 hypothetical protein HXX76_007941 [Chlamydomonas incerta]
MELKDADETPSFRAFHCIFIAISSGLGPLMTGQLVPPVATATRVKVAKMAVDTQLLPALNRLVAALVDSEASGIKRLAAAARVNDPAVGPLNQEQTPRAATVEYCGVCIRAFIEAAMGPDADRLRAVGLPEAVASSGVLPRLARCMMVVSSVAAELDEALTAAAAAGRPGGSRGASGSRGNGGTVVRVHREGAIKQIRRVAAIILQLWDGHTAAIQEAAGRGSAPAAGGKGAEAATLRWLEGLLSDPCVQHFMLQHVMAQVAAADGGSCYGMPPRLVLLAPEPVLPESDAMRLEISNYDPFHSFMAAAGGGVDMPLLLLDLVYTVVAGWTVHGRPPAAAAAARGGGADGSSGSAHQSLQWPPGAPWQARNVFAMVENGGHSGLLRRPQVPVRGMQGLLRRLVNVCLASLVPGIRRHLRELQAVRGGAASSVSLASLYTPAHTEPTATGKAFPARGSLMCATRAVLLAFSNRCLQAQERQRQRQHLQQQGGVVPGSSPEPEPQGDIRALWIPLVRITHACVDVAIVTRMDLGECGFDKTGPAFGAADADTKPAMYNEAVDALRFIERLMSPCGGLRLPRLPPAHNGLFTLLPEAPNGIWEPLDFGYIPALERLLRALHRTEGSNRELGHRSLGGFGLFASHFRSFEPTWAAAFAYGRPQEVASLMATSATVMRLMMSYVVGVADMTWDPEYTTGAVLAARRRLPGEMAMRRRLIRGPNLLQGMLTWLADSAATADSSPAAAAAAAAGWAAAAAEAPGGAPPAPGGLVPGERWWQRRWRQAAAAATGGASSSTSSSSSAFDWGVPQPALQALALCSFTLKRWVFWMARSGRNLCVMAQKAAATASGSAVSQHTVAICRLPDSPAAQADDDLDHIGTQTRTALGAACCVFRAVPVIVHAHLQCKEFAAEARQRADSSGAEAAAAAWRAAAAAAEAEAESWKHLLLDFSHASCFELVAEAAELMCCPVASRAVGGEHVRWALYALLHLAVAFPEEAARELKKHLVPSPFFSQGPSRPAAAGPVPRVTADAALQAACIQVLGLQDTGAIAAEFFLLGRLISNGRSEPADVESLKAGFPLLAPWCCVGKRPDALWARRVGALLPPPALAGELVGVSADMCANRACVRMVGDSAAAVTLSRCGGRCGGAVSYCCVECQRTHWSAGHKEACGKRAAAPK